MNTRKLILAAMPSGMAGTMMLGIGGPVLWYGAFLLVFSSVMALVAHEDYRDTDRVMLSWSVVLLLGIVGSTSLLMAMVCGVLALGIMAVTFVRVWS